jgi:hypothetical protein
VTKQASKEAEHKSIVLRSALAVVLAVGQHALGVPDVWRTVWYQHRTWTRKLDGSFVHDQSTGDTGDIDS